jgi:hypothetical protein
MRKMYGRGMRTNREDQKGEISLTSAIKCVKFVKKWYPYIFENSQRDGLLICFFGIGFITYKVSILKF